MFLEFQILCLQTGLTLTGFPLRICGRVPTLASPAATDACCTCGCWQPVVLRLEQPDDSDGRWNGYSAEDIAPGAILNCSCPCTKITVSRANKTDSYSINTTLLTLCHCDMFRPSKGHNQGAQLIHFNGKVKGQTKIQLINFIFMDPCIVVWISRNNQQDATF